MPINKYSEDFSIKLITSNKISLDSGGSGSMYFNASTDYSSSFGDGSPGSMTGSIQFDGTTVFEEAAMFNSTLRSEGDFWVRGPYIWLGSSTSTGAGWDSISEIKLFPKAGEPVHIEGDLNVTGAISGLIDFSDIDGDSVFDITSTADISLDTSANLHLLGGPYVVITADTAVSINGGGSTAALEDGFITLTVNNDAEVSGDCLITLTGNDSSDYSHTCLIKNDNTGDNADVLLVQMGTPTPTDSCKFIRFRSSYTGTVKEDEGNLRGSIRGSASDSSLFLVSDGGNITATSETAGEPDLNYDVGAEGDVVFASGNADYGEWFEVGDPLEWVSKEKYDSIFGKKHTRFGIPEGTVVYIREKELHRAGPGVPMVVTNRAILVGNEKESREHDNGWHGEVLSFVGQVPVICTGPVYSGDYLIDAGDGSCISVSKDSLTFEQYKGCVGRALETVDKEERVMALCAINYN